MTPVLLGYIPAGLAFGVLARESGLSILATAVMSVFVFAGSAQFIMLAQMTAGLPVLSIAATVAIVNLRYLLMSTAIAARVSQFPFFEKLLFGAEVTDEVFVVNAARLDALSQDGDVSEIAEKASAPAFRAETHGIDVSSHVVWVGASVMGAVFGAVLGDIKRFGVDFALTGVFVALLAPRLRDKKQLLVALCAGVVSVALLLAGVGQWNVILATFVAASLGLLL